MSLRERSARTGFQILLKATCRLFGGKFHRNNQRPRTVRHGVAGWPVVMPIKTITHVICDPDVMTRWIDLTSNDVSDPFFNAVHRSPTGMEQTSAKSARCRQIAFSCTQNLRSGKGRRVVRISSWTGGPPPLAPRATARQPSRCDDSPA